MKNLNRREIILMGAAVVLLIYYLYDSGVLKTAGVAKTVQKTGESSLERGGGEIADIQKQTRMAAIVEVNWTGSWGKDPFFYVSPDTLEGSVKGELINRLFGSSDKSKTSGLGLTGISWLGNSGFALINESVVKEGDTIGGFKVDRIAFNYVILRKGTQTIRLSLNE